MATCGWSSSKPRSSSSPSVAASASTVATRCGRASCTWSRRRASATRSSEAALAALLLPVARARGLRLATEPGLYEQGGGGRVPELAVVASANVTHRGVEGGAVLVVEIRSPGDETVAKIPFYERFGVEELLIVDRDTATVELLRRCDSVLVPALAEDQGWRTCSLGVGFRPARPNVLEVRLPGGNLERC